MYLYGGFSTTYDQCSDNLYIFKQSDSNRECVLVAGTKTRQESGWSDEELKCFRARVQTGQLPGQRCGHGLYNIGSRRSL